MGDNHYLAGECKVNDFSKKKEMNDLIIKILDKSHYTGLMVISR